MTDLTIRFGIAELNDKLPAEGYHEAVVASARMRRSQNGNPMLQVTYDLPQASPGCDTVPEYFVLAGSTPRACTVSRRRLFALYHACGFHPRDGEVLRPADLVGSQLEIRLGHETYDGTLRLRVLGYRAAR
jgi:hypothetical protein